MESKAQEAVTYFQKGFNCTQSVFSAFCESLGLDKKTALKIATPFGGGMRNGEVCGAVTGALMILGLNWGQDDANDKDVKENAYALTREYMNAFKSENGSYLCRELLGMDISTDEGRNLAKEKGLFDAVCPKVIRSAAQIVEKMI